MDQYISLISMLFFVFFVVATATEAVLELLRKPLENFGITPIKPKMSLDEAIKMASDFASPARPSLTTKLEAISAFTKNVGVKIEKGNEITSQITSLKKLLGAVTTQEDQDNVTQFIVKLIGDINQRLDQNLDSRVRILRLLSFCVALALCFFTGTNAIALASHDSLELKNAFMSHLLSGGATDRTFSLAGVVGTVLTAVAASSGSSYWHDQLDKFRKIKSLQGQFQAKSGG